MLERFGTVKVFAVIGLIALGAPCAAVACCGPDIAMPTMTDIVLLSLAGTLVVLAIWSMARKRARAAGVIMSLAIIAAISAASTGSWGALYCYVTELTYVTDADRSIVTENSLTYNPDSGCYEVSYTLREPAIVSGKILARGTKELYLRTVVDWKFQEAGHYHVGWDGKDYSGGPVPRDKADLQLAAFAAHEGERGTLPLREITLDEMLRERIKHDHSKHHDWACETPVLRIVSISDGATLAGNVEIRAEVDKDKRGYGDVYGYGVRYYVDYQLVAEEFYGKESDGKFSYLLDTAAFSDGPHVFSIGICDHKEHATSQSMRVYVLNEKI